MTVDGVELYPVHVAYTNQPIHRETYCIIPGWSSWHGHTREEAASKATTAVAEHLGINQDQVLLLVH